MTQFNQFWSSWFKLLLLCWCYGNDALFSGRSTPQSSFYFLIHLLPLHPFSPPNLINYLDQEQLVPLNFIRLLCFQLNRGRTFNLVSHVFTTGSSLSPHLSICMRHLTPVDPLQDGIMMHLLRITSAIRIDCLIVIIYFLYLSWDTCLLVETLVVNG